MDQEALLRYAYDAAQFSTGHCLPDMQFAQNHAGQPDVAMFDFTCMHRAENASLVRERKGKKLLMGLVGDCLVEVRGHVSVLEDLIHLCVHMLRHVCVCVCVLTVGVEVYMHLSQIYLNPVFHNS